MNTTVRMMLATATAVILPLLPSGSTQGGQGAQQEISLESRISQLQQEIAQKPRDANLHFELSKLYEEDIERYYDEALSEFKVAVDRGLKGKTVIWNNLGDANAHIGLVALEAGNYDKAIKNFEAAAKFNPNHYSMHTNMAVAYRHKGELNKAIECSKKAIDLNPLISSLYGSTGMLYLENKDFRLSILNLNRDMYLNDSSENKVTLFNIAQAYYGLKEYSNAIEALDLLPRDLRRNDKVKVFRQECVGLLNN